MDNMNAPKKSPALEKAKTECIAAVVAATGWSEEEALAKIEDCRARIGITYTDYRRMRMYLQEPAAQKAYYKKALERRERQKAAQKKCVDAVIDETGWTQEEAVKNIQDCLKRLNIQYRDYVQAELFRVPPEEQEAYYHKYVLTVKEGAVPARPTAAPASGGAAPAEKEKPRPLLKSEVCAFFGIPFDNVEEKYTELTIASRAKPGALAVLISAHKRKSPRDVVGKIVSNSDTEGEEALAKTAISKGAKRVLTTKELPGYPCLTVKSKDLFNDMVKLLRYRRDQLPVRCVEVTGSYGKTTTMNMLEAMFETKYNVLGIKGENYNIVRRAVHRVQQITASTDIYLQEAAENIVGAPGVIAEIVHPTVAIVTSVGTSHISRIGSQEKIAESCLTVQTGMSQTGLLILNGDDPLLRKAKTSISTVYYSIKDSSADFYARDIVESDNLIRFNIVHHGDIIPAQIRCIGRHNVSNALAVYAAGLFLDMSSEEAVAGLLTYAPLGMRQNLLRQAGYQFYLDCYNASVESMKSSLDALSAMQLAPGGKKIAVLADILESGSYAERFHRDVGQHIRGCDLDILICYGENARFIAEEAAANRGLKIEIASSHKEIVALIRKIASPKDVILLKGSHGMSLELVPDEMLGTWFHEYCAPATRFQDSLLSYLIYAEHAVVRSANASAKAVWIPDLPKALPVTSVGESAFEYAQAEMVVLPTVLTSIRRAAFRNMMNLKCIRFPNALRMVDAEAFAGCGQLKQVFINDGCLTLGDRAFAGCEALETVEIPASVVQISDNTFEGCSNMTIKCDGNSYAESFALKFNIPIVYRDSKKYLPEKPYLPKISEISNKGIEVYWKRPEKADGYCVFRSYNILGPYEKILQTKTRGVGTYFDTEFDHEKKHVYYTIRSFLRDADQFIYSEATKPVTASFREKLVLERTESYLYSGSEKAIHAYYGWGEPDDVEWSSDNPKVAVVKDGMIHAIGAGNCSISCTSKKLNQYALTKVIVDRPAPEPLEPIVSAYRFDSATGHWIQKKPRKNGEAVIMMVGDMMCGLRQQTDQYDKKHGYCFNESYHFVREVTAASDFAIGNLETLLASGWPYMQDECYINNQNNCNAPARYLDAVRYGGFDAVVMANNHNCDGGTRALQETIEQVDKYCFARTGAFRDEKEPRYMIADVNGIKVGFVAYTSRKIGFNRKDASWTQEEKDSMLHTFKPEAAVKDIHACRAAGAEYVIAYMHWGEKNFRNILPYQITEAQAVADAGADYIVGANPHLLQKYDVIHSADGRSIPCFYSTGNFQSIMNQVPGNRDSVLIRICLKRGSDGTVCLAENNYIPFYTYTEAGGCRWAPVALSSHINTGVKKRNQTTLLARITDVIGTAITQYEGDLPPLRSSKPKGFGLRL